VVAVSVASVAGTSVPVVDALTCPGLLPAILQQIGRFPVS